MKLNFEIIKEVGSGSFPDVLNFGNTQAQLLFLQNGKLYGNPSDEIPFGEWGNTVLQNNMNISPNDGMSNFEVKILPGWGGVGGYKANDTHNIILYEFSEYDYRNYVDYKSYVEVRDADNVKTAFLHPQADGVKDCFVDNRLNGDSVLEFSLPANSAKIDVFTPECALYAGWKAYILKDDSIDTIRDDNNRLWTKVTAVERFYELDESFVEPSISNDPLALPPADLAIIIVGGGIDLSDGRYTPGTASHALYAILKGSNWKLGVCDVEGIYDIEMEKESRLSIIKAIQNIWGGYLVWDSVNRVVSLRDGAKWQRYNGFQIKYAKNLKHITRTQSNRLITKLYPFGHDNLDIAAVNNGVKFITNNEYSPREYVGTYQNQDIYSQTELMAKAVDELKLISRPRYLYKVKLVDIRTLAEFSHEDYFLGDMIDIVDSTVAPDSPRPRLIRHRYNLFRPWECDFDIGDPEERLIEKLKASFNIAGMVSNKFNRAGSFSGHNVEPSSISIDKIANFAISGDMISDLAIESRHMSQNAIERTHIKNLAINGDKIDDLAIEDAHIQYLTITGGKIAPNAISDGKISGVSASKITAGILAANIELTNAILKGNSSIDVTADSNFGKKVFLRGVAVGDGIRFSPMASAELSLTILDPTLGIMKLTGGLNVTGALSAGNGASGTFNDSAGNPVVVTNGIVTSFTSI